jgi:hypothetical protein
MMHITKIRAALATGAIAVAVFAAVSLSGIGQAQAGYWVCNAFGACWYVPTCNAYGYCG